MTVTNNYDTITYIANGTTTNFPWTYDYDATYGALVVKNETDDITYVEGEDYTITNKTVIFNSAPANGKKIVLSRFTYRGQEVTFIEGEDFPAKDYETSLDRLFMIEQEQDKALADETAARIVADEVLQANIDAEEAARIAGDNDLQSAINNEAATRISKDNMLLMLIGNETDAREAADTALQSAIDNEISAREQADTAITNSIGNGTITLTQGGVTRGTFTTNQSGNTTIDLDAGGSGGGELPKRVVTRTPTFSGTTTGYIDVSDMCEVGKQYTPIVITSDNTAVAGSSIAEARKNLNSKCSYDSTNRRIVLTYSDNSYVQTNIFSYALILLPIQTGTSVYVAGITDGLNDYLDNAQTTNNLVTSISSSSTDTQYPSAKCVYDIVGNIETLLQSI